MVVVTMRKTIEVDVNGVRLERTSERPGVITLSQLVSGKPSGSQYVRLPATRSEMAELIEAYQRLVNEEVFGQEERP